MDSIAIVGTGISGLHLALTLQSAGVETTVYAERTPDQLRAGRLPNLVCRFEHTRARERAVGSDHWPLPGFETSCVHVEIGGVAPLAFRGGLRQPASFVDFRLYLARLLEDYEERGGRVVLGPVSAEDVVRLGNRHPLVAVASGRTPIDALFPRDPARSPYAEPQRILCAGLFRGIGFPEPIGLTFVASPGVGEVFQSPFWSFEGEVSGLLFSAVPGGPLEQLARIAYEDNPRAFGGLALRLLKEHAPAIAERVDPLEFRLTRPLDLLQGGITPTVRRAWAHLGDNRFAVAVGDAWVLNDPITGQGANLGSHCAAVLARRIVSARTYDEQFCRGVEQEMWQFAGPVTEWTNAALQPPAPRVMDLLAAAAEDKAVADALAENYNDPPASWRALATPEGAAAMVNRVRSPVPAGGTHVPAAVTP